MNGPRLYRSSDRIIGGVCAGLAEGFHVDALWVRVAFLILIFIQGIGVFLYIVLWLVGLSAGAPKRLSEPEPRVRSHPGRHRPCSARGQRWDHQLVGRMAGGIDHTWDSGPGSESREAALIA